MNPALGLALAAIAAVTLGAALRAGSGRRAAALALIGAAIGLLLLRQIWLAGALGTMGFSLWRSAPRPTRAPSPGQRSEVRTRGLRMTLDHDSGEMDGEVLEGRFAGARLSDLSLADLQALAQEFAAHLPEEDESLALLTAYMERRGADREEKTPPPDDGEMTEAEAYRILGLDPGASIEEVRAAYRRLIRLVHPDLGGSSPLAAMLNAAKQQLDPD